MQRIVRIFVPTFFFAALVLLASSAGATAISDVNIQSITATSAIVTWTTDIKSDATINYSTDPSYGIVRDPTFTGVQHSLTIPNLLQDTTYHVRVESTDSDGNTSATGGFVFTTTPDQNQLTQQIKQQIPKVTNPADLQQISQTLQQTASAVLKPPTILGQAKVAPDVTSAEITWNTDRASGSVVKLEPDSSYSGSYSITQGDASESNTSHDVTVIGLDPNTKYHYVVSSTDSLGLVGQTTDDTFTTKSALPAIQSRTISNISESVATVNWNTGSVLASGEVDFTDLRSHRQLSMGDPAFLTHHAVELTNLIFGTSYSVVIKSTNQSGDVVTSNPITFTTVRDTVPPKISKVTNQSTLFPSDNVEVQTIITWQTDEPAYCQLFYIHGIVKSATNPPSSQPIEQNPLTDHTQVIVGLTPSAVYKFWVQCHDAANNQSQSDDYVMITPDKEKSIIDLILQNFQGTFGWVNNIGK